LCGSDPMRGEGPNHVSVLFKDPVPAIDARQEQREQNRISSTSSHGSRDGAQVFLSGLILKLDHGIEQLMQHQCSQPNVPITDSAARFACS